MKLKKQHLQILCQQAIKAAVEAGQFISSFTNQQFQVRKKHTQNSSSGPMGGTSLASQVVTEADIKSQEIILKHLYPSIQEFHLGLLAEESIDNHSRFEKDYFWCIDPLDGTLPFTEGRSGYSVSIALVSQKGIPVIGVIYDPVKKNLYHAIKGMEICKNHQRFHLSLPTPTFTFITDRSMILHPNFKQIKANLIAFTQLKGYAHFQHINQGGAAMNAIWLLENNPGCYFKLPKKNKGGGSLWDFAATSCLFNELNIPASDFTGNPLHLNAPYTTFMNEHGVFYGVGIDLKDIQSLIPGYKSNNDNRVH